MTVPIDNETWVIEAGDAVIQKKARSGLGGLAPWERLVYCLWVTDYGMRNAGDLATAHDVWADFQSEARRIAEDLLLRLTHEAFSLRRSVLEREYFIRFDEICHEIRNAEPGIAVTVPWSAPVVWLFTFKRSESVQQVYQRFSGGMSLMRAV